MKNIHFAILSNRNNIQNRVCTVAFQAFLTGIMKDIERNPKMKHGMRYQKTLGYYQYVLASSLLSATAFRFEKANLFEDAAPYPRTCRKNVAQFILQKPGSRLDTTQDGISQRFRDTATSCNIEVCTISVDEMVNLKALIFI